MLNKFIMIEGKEESKPIKIKKGKPTPTAPPSELEPKSQLPPQKSVFVAYLWWLFGGVFGAHHIYLHRDRQAFVWWCTLGKYNNSFKKENKF